jgi:hypothetical protein
VTILQVYKKILIKILINNKKKHSLCKQKNKFVLDENPEQLLVRIVLGNSDFAVARNNRIALASSKDGSTGTYQSRAVLNPRSEWALGKNPRCADAGVIISATRANCVSVLRY